MPTPEFSGSDRPAADPHNPLAGISGPTGKGLQVRQAPLSSPGFEQTRSAMTAARTTTFRDTKRLAAGGFYALLAVGALGMLLNGSGSIGTFVVGALCAAYAWYLFKGGTVVVMLLPVWLWLPLMAWRYRPGKAKRTASRESR